MDFGAMTFEEALAATDGPQRTLLLGAGFSPRQFHYSSLLAAARGETAIRFADGPPLPPNAPLGRLFDALGTQDFEAVIAALERASTVSEVFERRVIQAALQRQSAGVREALIKTIGAAHPRFRDGGEGAPPPDYAEAHKFLNRFARVFTLNYDLFVYWAGMEGDTPRCDGFGLGKPRGNGLHGPFRPTAHCTLWNLHGGLHLFEDPMGDLCKATHAGEGMVAALMARMEAGVLPLFVAEGSCTAKRRKIAGSPYLRHCLEELRRTTGHVFTFGHAARENDAHVYEAIFQSNATHLHVGFFAEAERAQIVARIDSYQREYQPEGATIAVSLLPTADVKLWPDA